MVRDGRDTNKWLISATVIVGTIMAASRGGRTVWTRIFSDNTATLLLGYQVPR